MKAAHKVICIRTLPSLDATQRAIATVFARGPVSMRSLRYAFAVLTVVLHQARWGRLPAGWDTGRTCFTRGYARHNAEVALDKARTLLEPLDFDVDFAIPTAEEPGDAARNC